jgi:arylsulfatase A-like enzyme
MIALPMAPPPKSEAQDKRGRSLATTTIWLVASCLAAACNRSRPGPQTTRLVDVFEARLVSGSAATTTTPPRTEWRFDGPPPALPRPAAPSGAGLPPAAAPPRPALAATHGWEAGPGILGLAIHDGRLVGRSTTDFPILHLERTSGLENPDQLQAVEVRMRVSAGANLWVRIGSVPAVDLAREPARGRAEVWRLTSPIVAGEQTQTYTITAPSPVTGARIRHLLIRPTDVAGATFSIESVRLIFRREHLAGMPSGVSWQGLRDIFHETLVTRTPETARFRVTLPSRPILDLAMGTPEEAAVNFRVAVERPGQETVVLSHSVTTPYRWDRKRVDLGRFAGTTVTLSLSASADKAATVAFWGSPVIRQRAGARGGPPETVILIQMDALRSDHLDVYGYERRTAPTLSRLAGEGALFRHALSQTSWTKAAVPSILTSLYPSTHGVHAIPDRLPSSAVTIAEAYRQAGYATLSFSSTSFTGAFSNLHQGFEELHEVESTVGRNGPRGAKTAREYVDRLTDWLHDHGDVPSFVFLHVFDPHAPYEPYRPYDTTWADPKGREEYLRQQEVLKSVITNGFLAQNGMATRDELAKAGIDPESYIRYSKDWYDGSILGMDHELARLLESLEEGGLRDRALVALYADHGEEFLDHGRMWHGQSVYGEMIRVPLIVWAPGRVPAGTEVQETVQLIDVMPTLLELSGIRAPKEVQGQSMLPLLTGPNGRASVAGGWKSRPAIAERQPGSSGGNPEIDESYAIVDGRWKLVRNVVRAPRIPEFELYDYSADPLDQKNLADGHRDEVARLARALEAWHQMAASARLKSDNDVGKDLSPEQLEQLRSLGYVK